MKVFFITLLFTSVFNQYICAIDDKNENEQIIVKNHYELLSDFNKQEDAGFFDVDFTRRKVNALIFSSIVPGSGQTYLGSELKGMGISLAFYSTALTAIVAHNNAKGREDRIKVLTQDYITKGNYEDAEEVWQTILSEKENRDNDYTRRSIFTWCAVGVWVYNIVDVIFLTDDQGEGGFAQNNPPVELDIVGNHDFHGVALKLNLP